MRYKKNAGLVGTFLSAHLLMYFILGEVLASLGFLVNEYMNPVFTDRLSTVAYIITGITLLINSLGIKFPWGCNGTGCKVPKLRRIGNDWITAIVAGLATGLYIGTLPFFVPLLGIPFFTKRISSLKAIARVSQFLVSIYFIVMLGLLPFFFG